MVLLADLLATRSLDLRLVGGDPAVPVRWVATSELDDPTAFLEGGELLLTTGLRTPRGGWPGWVERLVAAGVAGVGFGVGLSHRTLPRTLVGAAAADGLALVEVPVPTPFIAISRRLADLLRRSENEAEAAAARTQRDLAVDAGGPEGVAAVLRRVARSSRGRAWLLDGSGTVRASSGDGQPPAVALEGLRRVRAQGARAAWNDVSPAGSLSLRATGSEGTGWLLVAAAPDVPRALHGTLGTAAALLGLLATRADDGIATGCVVDLLVEGHVDVARRLARSLPVDLPDPVVVLRWSGAPPPGLRVGERYALGSPADVERALTGWTGGRAGVGAAVDLPRAADGAAAADVAFARTSDARPVVRGDARALPDVLDPEVLRPWAASRLAGFDTVPDGAELVATTRAFLEHHGARQPTADALGLHRNTVRQRLRRVEDLLGVSFDAAADRAELWLALTTRDRVR